MTLYRETPCEHGFIDTHAKAGNYGDIADKWCPGGSREKVTIDYEAAGRKFHDIVYGPADTLVAMTDPSIQNGRAIVDTALVTHLKVEETASTV